MVLTSSLYVLTFCRNKVTPVQNFLQSEIQILNQLSFIGKKISFFFNEKIIIYSIVGTLKGYLNFKYFTICLQNPWASNFCFAML